MVNNLVPYSINSGSVESADGKYNIAEAPLYFVRSGYTHINIGKLRYSGENGYEWSSLANSSDLRYAYYLAFDASDVYPSNDGHNRWIAFPLRCSSIDSNSIYKIFSQKLSHSNMIYIIITFRSTLATDRLSNRSNAQFVLVKMSRYIA